MKTSRVLVSLLSAALPAGLLIAQQTSATLSQVPVTQVSGQRSARMPRSQATLPAMEAAAAASPDSPTASQDGPSPSPLGPGPGCNLFPAPASVGASVPISYFGPPPSASNPSLVGPYQLLQSGKVNTDKGTLTLPLYKGKMKRTGKTVWYILTDVNDQSVATLLGLNFSAKLGFAGVAARTANFDANNDLVFDAGTVNFQPGRILSPGAPEAFPPSVAQPGAIGDRNYSPIVRVLNAGGVFYNAPMIAYDVEEQDINFPNGNVDYRKVHDQVLAIDPYAQTVTLQLINGFSFGRPLWYISTDASTATAAAIEGNTYAPLLARIVTGRDDSFSSPVERIFIATNGSTGCDNPQRQGLDAAIADGFRPNNTFGGVPTIATDYSPLWNAQLYEWTPDAVNKGYRQQLREEFQILTYVNDHLITGPAGALFGDSKFVINCPPVQRLQ